MLDYFGADLIREPLGSFPKTEALLNMESPVQGFLLLEPGLESPLIWVNPDLSRGRARWTIYHEVAHLESPSHDGTFYLDDERALRPSMGRNVVLPTETRTAGYQGTFGEMSDPIFDEAFAPVLVETAESLARKRQEREANQYAAELIMPTPMFFPEARSLPIEINTISSLSDRYQTSFEATALRYSQACPERCAVFALEPVADCDGVTDSFQIVYCRRTSRFLRGLRVGLQIRFSGLFAEGWEAKGPVHGRLAACDLGLGPGPTINVDVLRLGQYERMVALLWLQSGQMPIFDGGYS